MGTSPERLKRYRIAAIASAVLVLTVYVAACISPGFAGRRSLVASAILFVIALVGTCASIITWSRVRGADKRLWLLITGAVLSLTAANGIELLWIATRHMLTRSPSPDDAFLMAALVLLAVVSFSLGNPLRARRIRRLENTLDFVAILGAAFVVGYLTVIVPLAFVGPDVSVERTVIMSIYVTLPFAIAVFPVIFRDDPWTTWGGLLVVGIAFGAGYGVTSMVVSGRGLYYINSAAAHLAQAPLALFYVFVALAGLWRVLPAPGGSGPRPAADIPRWPGFVVLVIAVPGVPFAIYYALGLRDHSSALVIGLAAAGVAAVLMVRTIVSSVADRQLGEVRAEVAHYRALVEDSPVSVFVLDESGSVVFANKAAARTMHAASPYDLIGRHASELVPTQAQAKRAMDMVSGALRDYEISHQPLALAVERVQWRTLDGEVIDIERTASSMSYAGRPAVLVMGIVVSERVRAEAEAAEYRDRLEALAAELVSTEERERRRLAEALHDHVGQQLAVARMRLQAFGSSDGGDPEDYEVALSMLESAIAETRDLTTELAPAILYELGLTEALRWVCGEMRRVHGLLCTVSGFVDDGHLDDEQRALLFRASRELLMNVVKHARAHKATIELSQTADWVEIVVEDDGTGYDVTSANRSGSFGLLSVEQSLAGIGGGLETVSSEFSGTRSTIRVPLEAVPTL